MESLNFFSPTVILLSHPPPFPFLALILEETQSLSQNCPRSRLGCLHPCGGFHVFLPPSSRPLAVVIRLRVSAAFNTASRFLLETLPSPGFDNTLLAFLLLLWPVHFNLSHRLLLFQPTSEHWWVLRHLHPFSVHTLSI